MKLCEAALLGVRFLFWPSRPEFMAGQVIEHKTGTVKRDMVQEESAESDKDKA
jgi:hypothetical protein